MLLSEARGAGLAHPRRPPRGLPSEEVTRPRPARQAGWNPTTFALVLTWVPKAYYDPKRLRPRDALLAGTTRLELAAPEVVVSGPDARGRLHVQAGPHRRAFGTRDVRDWMQMGDRLLEVLRFVDRALGDPSQRDALQYAAIAGVLSTLDPHSTFFTPEEFRRRRSQFTGSRVGIGVTLAAAGGEIAIASVNPHGPAARAGLRPGDVLLRVGSLSMGGLTPFIAARRLEGTAGSRVRVVVRRGPPPGRRIARTLVRQVVEIPSVKGRMLPGRIALLRIHGMPKNLLASFEQALRPLRRQRPRGWILDLRGNEGGYIEQAARVADFFLPEGLLCVASGRGGQRTLTWRVRPRPDRLTGPVVVLVNARTASAAEILAGDLALSGRAILIGEPTWGKGTVQKLVPLQDGSAVKLTLWQYLLKGRHPIQAAPIVPDVELFPVSLDPTFPQLLAAGQARREASQARHLDAAAPRQVWKGRPLARIQYLAPGRKEGGGTEPAAPPRPRSGDAARGQAAFDGGDFPLAVALKVAVMLRGTRERATQLRRLREVLEPVRNRAARQIAAALRAAHILWDAPPHPAPAPQLEARLEPPFQRTTAGQPVRLRLTVRNRGTAPAYRIAGRFSAFLDGFHGREVLLGKLAPGQQVTRTLRFSVPRGLRTRVEWLRLALWTGAGPTRPGGLDPKHAAARTQAAVLLRERPRPRLRLGWELDDRRDGSGDGQLDPGERARLRLFVRNDGPFEATALRVDVTAPTGCVVPGAARLALGALAPGEVREATLPLSCRKGARSADAPGPSLRVTAYDRVLGGDLSVVLSLPAGRGAAKPFAPHPGSARTRSPRTHLVAWAGPDALRVGHVPAGTVLLVEARRGDWLRVGGLPGGRFAFVTRDEVTTGPPVGPPAALLTPHWPVVAPRVTLGPAPEVTNHPSLWLVGHARSSTGVQDVWVRCWNPEAPSARVDKLLYHRGPEGGLRHLQFRFRVPLHPGTNYVVADARDVSGVVGQARVAIYRRPTEDRVTPQPAALEASTGKAEAGGTGKAVWGCHCGAGDGSSSGDRDGLPAVCCLLALLAWTRRREARRREARRSEPAMVGTAAAGAAGAVHASGSTPSIQRPAPRAAIASPPRSRYTRKGQRAPVPVPGRRQEGGSQPPGGITPWRA